MQKQTFKSEYMYIQSLLQYWRDQLQAALTIVVQPSHAVALARGSLLFVVDRTA